MMDELPCPCFPPCSINQITFQHPNCHVKIGCNRYKRMAILYLVLNIKTISMLHFCFVSATLALFPLRRRTREMTFASGLWCQRTDRRGCSRGIRQRDRRLGPFFTSKRYQWEGARAAQQTAILQAGFLPVRGRQSSSKSGEGNRNPAGVPPGKAPCRHKVLELCLGSQQG